MNQATLQNELSPSAPPVAPLSGVVVAELVDENGSDVIVADLLPMAVAVRSIPRLRSRWWPIIAAWRITKSTAEWLFGAVAIIGGLAILAAIPILQFLSLGYLLEAAGRIGKTGKLSAGFVGYRKAARVGGIVVGVTVVLIPLRLTASLWRSAMLIDPESNAARVWGLALAGLTLLIACHLALAFWRGAKLRHFLWPFFNPFRLLREVRGTNPLAVARDRAWEFFVGLRLPHYFWLGLCGFAGGLIWLAIPVSLLALGGRVPAAGWIGALLLACVLPALPFLQTHLAVEGRFRAMFDRGGVRRLFAKAPLAFWFALLVTLLSALPLYLLKIEMVPREAAWLPSLVFVMFILPARLITGWAYGRGRRREVRRIWLSRVAARLGMLPVVGFYVLIVFFTQYTAWYGKGSLYEQHAFLVPVPFLDW